MPNIDENKIRQIVRDEIARNKGASRFDVQNIPFHDHNGINSPKVEAGDLIPSTSMSGNITFEQATTYTINLNSNFTPTRILVYGNVLGSGSQRYFTFGSANLTPSFFLQPQSTTSVAPNNVQYPFIDPNLDAVVPLQSSAYFGAEAAGGALHTLSSEGHVVNVAYPLNTIHARATVTAFSKNKITIVVSFLDAGWSINANYVIT